jgi:hypothetical protein
MTAMDKARREQITKALDSCGPERRWKTDKVIDGSVLVGNGHCFVAISPEEYANLGAELVDISEANRESVAKWIAFDKTNGAPVERLGIIKNDLDDEQAVAFKFGMGWKFPVRRRFVETMGTGKTTGSVVGDGFLVVSRSDDGRVISGAMSLGRYSQALIDELLEEGANK